jgi:hypothetical protein
LSYGDGREKASYQIAKNLANLEENERFHCRAFARTKLSGIWCAGLIWSDLTPICAQGVRKNLRNKSNAHRANVDADAALGLTMLAGEKPLPIVAITYQAMNEGRGASDPIREPGSEDIELYRAYFGNMIGDGTVTLLAPLVAADPLRLDQDTVCEAIDRLRAFVGRMPVTRIDFRYLDIGCVADRHGFFAPLRPVRARGEFETFEENRDE